MARFEVGKKYKWTGFGSATNIRTFEVLRFTGNPGDPDERVVISVLTSVPFTTTINRGMLADGLVFKWNPQAINNCEELA